MSMADLPLFAVKDDSSPDKEAVSSAAQQQQQQQQARKDDDDVSLINSLDSDDHDDKSSSDSFDEMNSGRSGFTSRAERHRKERTRKLFAWKENTAVRRSKTLMLLGMVIGCFIAASVVARVVRRKQEIDFKNNFETFARQIASLVDKSTKQNLASVHALATTTTIMVLDNAMVFPNVTIPFFRAGAREVQTLTKGATGVAFAPLVQADETEGWEAYASSVLGHPISVRGPPSNDTTKVHLPVWQSEPAPLSPEAIGIDMMAAPLMRIPLQFVQDHRRGTLMRLVDMREIAMDPRVQLPGNDPHSVMVEPVFEHLDQDADPAVAGVLLVFTPWTPLMQDLLPNHTNGVNVVIHDSCDDSKQFSYLLNGNQGVPLEWSDQHQMSYDRYKIRHYVMSDDAPVGSIDNDNIANEQENLCRVYLDIFPTANFESESNAHELSPAMIAGAVVGVFAFMIALFSIYDYAVIRRQKKLLSTAQKTNAIVANLFPENVHSRLIEEAGTVNNRRGGEDSDDIGIFRVGKRQKIRSFLDGSLRKTDTMSSPIADLFPETTIMFADLVGFTAWSSAREPSQVFYLLEAVYAAFDSIANRRRIFKVETVGDCYVAAAGIPDPRRDHAVAMARFAKDCLAKFSQLTKTLEVELGPDTADLALRVGLHSGPVTAGVLRGERARFQLFGDTMNVTSRMESSGKPNKIHISQEMADLLIAGGKVHWIREREDTVVAKGKGELRTFWLDFVSGHASSTQTPSEHESQSPSFIDVSKTQLEELDGLCSGDAAEPTDLATRQKMDRLVDWMSQLLAQLLQSCVARRIDVGQKSSPESMLRELEHESLREIRSRKGASVLGEVEEIIDLPQFSAHRENQTNPETIQLSEAVMSQLQQYVAEIGARYKSNPFHSFEHASHVTMSVVKLLSRIVAPDLEDGDAKNLHDHTYGITSDPLTQFACVVSAMIHDVDHPGVPNATLCKEATPMAVAYNKKSVAEQNSIDLAWDLLMQDRFKDLRRTIYTSTVEFKRFRQLLVNSVMATDIMDKELGSFRKARWDKAFAEQSCADLEHASVNRKATIVIEHLIQASDVAHTMQHWHVYAKWNERLFFEMYKAYQEGRSDKDPAENWYKGEIGFFDFYIIPLAKKLDDCGVFGVSSHEYLTYAIQNRSEWESKGCDIVARYLNEYGSSNDSA